MARLIALVLFAAAALAGAVPAAFGQTAPIISDMHRFHPVLARHAMVVSQERLATEVGVDVLKRGGNAVDAAVAVGFALAVTLPRAGNLGGGGFMLVHLAATGETLALDYRETAPAATTRAIFLDERGEADPRKSRATGLGVGVPGTVAGLALAHQRWGSGRFTLAQLIAPAVRLAAEGFPASDDLAATLRVARERLTQFPSTAAVFYPGGEPPAPGAILRQPDLAGTLAAIAADGPRAFYEGAIAARIATAVQGAGGIMTAADLAAYAPKLRTPVTGTYRGHTILAMPPPSSGGVHLVQILNILEGYDLKALGAGSAAAIHVMAEAMKRAYADRAVYLGDPDFTRVPVAALTSKRYAAALREAISLERATPSNAIRPGTLAPYESGETTHFTVVDRDGNAVVNTYTLNFSYGVGLVAAGTGVLLNNELDDFAAKPGAPNAYGLVGDVANAPEANKRPLSSMTPTLVFKDGRLVLATGSPGGSRIITTVLQLLVGVIDHGMTIAEATAAPRVHHQWLPDELVVEEGISPDTVRLLTALGHKVVLRATSGSTQSVMILPDGWRAGAADPRRPGALAAGE